MLVSMLEIMKKAKEGGYGVLAPNVFNEDSVRACLEAAVELDSPVIIDVLPGNHKDLVSFGHIVRQLANEVRVPVALNLDHGDTYEACVQAIYGGFTGIMVDRSFLPFEENAKQVKYFKEIIYAFLTIFLYLPKCPQSLILSALRAFCFCCKPHISRSIFLYFRYQAWLKSW